MMNSNDPERLSAADQAFVDQIAELSEPTPMTASQRVAFTEALDTRIAARRRRRSVFIAVAAAAATASLVAMAVPRLFEPTNGQPVQTDRQPLVVVVPTPRVEPTPVPTPQIDRDPRTISELLLAEEPGDAIDTWEDELLFASDLDSVLVTSSDTDADELPEDYEAIASLFLDV